MTIRLSAQTYTVLSEKLITSASRGYDVDGKGMRTEHRAQGAVEYVAVVVDMAKDLT